MAAFSEGLILGESMGISREVLFDALFNGPAAAPFVAVKRQRIETANYGQADFALRWLQKDLHLAAISAYETGVAMPLTNVVKEIYRLAIREGHGDEDISAIYGYLARNRDVQPTSRSLTDRLHPGGDAAGATRIRKPESDRIREE